MKVLTVLFCASFLGAPAAAIINPIPIFQLPACPKNCIFSTMKQAGELGCPGAKPECMCKSKQYQAKLEACAKKCTAQESDQMRNVGRKICSELHALMGRDNEDYTEGDELEAEFLFDKEVMARQLPTGIFPTGIFPTGIIPTGIPTGLPTGLFPTGFPTKFPTKFPTGIFPTGIFPTGIFPTGIIPTGLTDSELAMPEMTKRAELSTGTRRTPGDRATPPGTDIPEPTYHTHARDFAM